MLDHVVLGDGFYVRLGDEMNGFHAEPRCATWAEVELWLDEQAHVHCPTAAMPKLSKILGAMPADPRSLVHDPLATIAKDH